MARILEKLRITEVSSVDRGAGEGVKVLIMKRDIPATVSAESLYDFAKADTLSTDVTSYLKRTFTADERRSAAASGAAMSDGSYPIENGSDLKSAVHAVGRGKNNSHAAIRRHIVTRARSLGLTSELPDDWKVKKGLVRKLLEAIGVAKATDFATAQADVETGEYAQDMMAEFGEALGALRTSICSIMCDDGVSDKQGAIEATLAQFKDHIQGVVPEGIENAMRGAALAAAGYEINDQGAVSKKGTPMTDDEKKALEAKEKEAADAKKALTVAKREIAVLKMAQKHKDYMDARGDTMSSDEKDKFSDMEPGERDAHMQKHPVAEDTEKRIAAEVAKRIAADPEVVSMRKRLDEMQKRDEIATVRKSWTAQGLTEPQMDLVQKAWDAAVDKSAIEPLVKQMATLNKQVAEGGLFNEIGGSGSAANTAHDEMMAKAAEMKKADPKLSIEQAYAKAYSDPANHDIAKRDVIERRNNLSRSAAA